MKKTLSCRISEHQASEMPFTGACSLQGEPPESYKWSSWQFWDRDKLLCYSVSFLCGRKVVGKFEQLHLWVKRVKLGYGNIWEMICCVTVKESFISKGKGIVLQYVKIAIVSQFWPKQSLGFFLNHKWKQAESHFFFLFHQKSRKNAHRGGLIIFAIKHLSESISAVK